jgi:MFS family permease
MVLVAGSLLVFSRLEVSTSFWGLLPGMLLGGLGMSIAMAPTTAAAMSSVRPDKAGVGSAVLNSMRQVGGSLGIAIMGAIVAAGVSSALAAGRSRPEAFVNGFHHAVLVAAAIVFAGAVIAFATLEHARPRKQAEEVPLIEAA